jgi:hypothetical protein
MAAASPDSEHTITQRERAYQYAARGMRHRSDGRVDIIEEMSTMHYVNWLDALAQRIATKDERPYVFVRMVGEAPVYALSALGRDIVLRLPTFSGLYLQSLYNGAAACVPSCAT